jgi:Lrp/AsnC family leucine-responsive transcriptional regulator
LDPKDLKIVSILSGDPDISQQEIAKQVNLSQPAVGMRIKKLKEHGVVSEQFGLDLHKAGIYLEKIDLIAKNIKDILKKFESCPLLFNGLITSGKNNLCLLLTAEDLSSLQSIITRHLKNNPDVERVEESIVITTSKRILYPIDYIDKGTSERPCRSSCTTCSFYRSQDCLGCPATESYRGNIWK